MEGDAHPVYRTGLLPIFVNRWVFLIAALFQIVAIAGSVFGWSIVSTRRGVPLCGSGAAPVPRQWPVASLAAPAVGYSTYSSGQSAGSGPICPPLPPRDVCPALQMAQVLKSEGYFVDRCPGGQGPCPAQNIAVDSMFTVASVASIISPTLNGYILDRYGPRLAIQVMLVAFLAGVGCAIAGDYQRNTSLLYGACLPLPCPLATSPVR